MNRNNKPSNEAARSRFDPGNRHPSDVRVLFKNSYKIVIKVRIGKSTPGMLTLQIAAFGTPLSNPPCK
jgi:hypothetical protein